MGEEVSTSKARKACTRPSVKKGLFAGRSPAELGWPAKPGSRKVSVIIPVLNESARIASVVKLALKSKRVGEVIVVDDGSIDGSPELAKAAGARVFTSKFIGKGGSMEEGLTEARYDTLLYLDGDLAGLSDDLVEQMTDPVLEGRFDFVKARFSRRAGRVTVLTARPLLRTYFPELAHFEQPLGGIVAARKELLSHLRFENDYGVDVGLLIDAATIGARLTEVDIGRIEHDSHELEYLGEMATQVARAILDRANACGRLRLSFVKRVRESEQWQRSNPERVLAAVGDVERFALFDMDGTLLAGRFIVELARRTGRETKLSRYLDRFDLTPETRTKRIAQVFRGVELDKMVKVAREFPLNAGAVEAVVGLRKLGYRVGIITESYHTVAEVVRRRVFADFVLANVLEFRRGKATGTVTLAPTFRSGQTGRRAYDKLNALRFLVKRWSLTTRDVVVVGDSENDVGMLRAVKKSFAFQPKSPRVRRAAKHVITTSLEEVLNKLQ